MSLLRVLTNLRLLTNDRNIYTVKDPEFEKLQKSFAELNIEAIKSSKALPRPLFVHGYEFLSSLGSNVLGRKEQKHQDTRPGAYRFDIGMYNEISPDNEKKDDAKEDTEITLQKNPLPPRKILKRDKPLTKKQFQEFIFEDGRISDPERIKEIIFRGGIEKEIRAELWKFLLGYDCWDHTNEERKQRRQNLLNEYYRMKTQWMSMSTNQEKNHSGYRDRKGQIEKDVKRTDRNLDFYSGDNNANIDTLQSILCKMN